MSTTLVLTLQEKVQEDEEPLGEILLVLAHGAGDIHQAEHDGLGARHRALVKTVIADVDRIDESHHPALPFEAFDLLIEIENTLAFSNVKIVSCLQLGKLDL